MREVLFFGCRDVPGHYLYARGKSIQYESSPWGTALDGGILTPDYYHADKTITGEVAVAHKNGWTAIAFWDRSGDSRPGSNSAFLISEIITGDELLDLARQQWPEIFSRPDFPTLKFKLVPQSI